MKKRETIKKKEEFNKIIKTAPYIKNQSFVVYIRKKSEQVPNYGIAISKKVGIAVIRNKLKRQVRALIDEQKENFKNQADYIIMIKRKCNEESFQKMRSDFIELVSELKKASDERVK